MPMGLVIVAMLVVAALLLLQQQRPATTPGAPVVFSPSSQPLDGPDSPPLPASTVRIGSGATREGVAGVPLGFPHTTDGAVAAASAWLTVVEGPGVLVAKRRAAVLSAIGDKAFTSAAGARLASRAATLGLRANGRPAAGYLSAVARPERGAYRVVYGAGADAALIEIWYPFRVQVVPDRGQPDSGYWQRARIPLRWDRSAADWRLSADLTFVGGPDPKVQQPSVIERAEALQGYDDGWHVFADQNGG
jgi:hypothetical protein